jgi:hypothetical protein
MRRVFIDLIGRIPTIEEIREFEKDTSPNKRVKLVNRLLNDTGYAPKNPATGKPYPSITGLKTNQGEIDYNDAYAQNFAELWSVWMLTRSNIHPWYREQFRAWLTNEFAKGTPWNEIVVKLVGATGKTNENAAVIFVMRHLGDPIVDGEARKQGIREDAAKNGRYDVVPVTSRVTKLFLGIQTQCVQCHNHPHNKEYLQSDFWGINAFFRQVNHPERREDNNRTGTLNPRTQFPDGTFPPPLSLVDETSWNMQPLDPRLGPAMVTYERRDGQKAATPPQMLRNIAQFEKGDRFSGKQLIDGIIPSSMGKKSRREVLAQWITEHDNFGRAFVNRTWGHLFGRGLNKEPSVADFNSNNEVVHAELLNYLADEFKKYNYDPKKLLEWICTSDVYQLSHVANKAYASSELDPFFARMPLKAMSPEVMFDSLSVATRAETRRGKDGEAAYRRLRDTWTQKLTQNFGDDEGNEITFNGTVVQALLMMNGRELNGEVGKGKDGVVADVVNRYTTRAGVKVRDIYDELFLMTVSRHPTNEELRKLEEVRMWKATIDLGVPAPSGTGTGTRPLPKGPARTPVPGADPKNPFGDVTYYQDVFWALLNSSEFMLNH